MSALVTLVCTCFAAASPLVHTDYYEAYRAADESGRLLMVDIGGNVDFSQFPAEQAERHVFCRVPVETTIDVQGREQRLLESSAFSTLERNAGVVVIDLQHNSPTHGRTVSALPQRYVQPGYVRALLSLPTGTLSQRTLVWAFRVHAERPQSVYGTASPDLMAHCARHSQQQANTSRMYHASSFPGSSEIVAQSWAWNHNVVDAALDVVRSWRQSPPHWSSASRLWSSYGFDMKKNGQAWFATGVFR